MKLSNLTSISLGCLLTVTGAAYAASVTGTGETTSYGIAPSPGAPPPVLGVATFAFNGVPTNSGTSGNMAFLPKFPANGTSGTPNTFASQLAKVECINMIDDHSAWVSGTITYEGNDPRSTVGDNLGIQQAVAGNNQLFFVKLIDNGVATATTFPDQRSVESSGANIPLINLNPLGSSDGDFGSVGVGFLGRTGSNLCTLGADAEAQANFAVITGYVSPSNPGTLRWLNAKTGQYVGSEFANTVANLQLNAIPKQAIQSGPDFLAQFSLKNFTAGDIKITP